MSLYFRQNLTYVSTGEREAWPVGQDTTWHLVHMHNWYIYTSVHIHQKKEGQCEKDVATYTYESCRNYIIAT